MKKKRTINAEKVLFFLAALIPALVFGGKNKKVAGHRIPKKCQKIKLLSLHPMTSFPLSVKSISADVLR